MCAAEQPRSATEQSVAKTLLRAPSVEVHHGSWPLAWRRPDLRQLLELEAQQRARDKVQVCDNFSKKRLASLSTSSPATRRSSFPVYESYESYELNDDDLHTAEDPFSPHPDPERSELEDYDSFGDMKLDWQIWKQPTRRRPCYSDAGTSSTSTGSSGGSAAAQYHLPRLRPRRVVEKFYELRNRSRKAALASMAVRLPSNIANPTLGMPTTSVAAVLPEVHGSKKTQDCLRSVAAKVSADISHVSFEKLDFGEASALKDFYNSHVAIVDISITSQQTSLFYHLGIRESASSPNIVLFHDHDVDATKNMKVRLLLFFSNFDLILFLVSLIPSLFIVILVGILEYSSLPVHALELLWDKIKRGKKQ